MRSCVRAGWLLGVMAAVTAVGVVARGSVGPRTASAPSWHLDIDRAMDAVGIRPGRVVGEAGAGDGYFTLPMARRIGAAGAVYANDIDQGALDRLARSARSEGLSNVHVVAGTVDDPLFPRRDLELIVIVHAFHDFGRPVEWLVNARKYLRPGGLVAIVDLDPDQGAPSHFLPRRRILEHAARAGYEAAGTVDAIPEYLVVALRPRAQGVVPGS